jgi:hypothetical protein
MFINSNLIYLIKLKRLLHERIDPTVESLRKKPQTLRTKRVERCKSTTCAPPKSAPSWCLNRTALEKFNRITDDILVYDDEDDENDEDADNGENSNKKNTEENKKKRKNKKRQETKIKKIKMYNLCSYK